MSLVLTDIKELTLRISQSIVEYSKNKEGVFRYYSFGKQLANYTKDGYKLSDQSIFETRHYIFRKGISNEIHNLFFIENNLSIELVNELGRKSSQQILSFVEQFNKLDFTYALAFSFFELTKRKVDKNEIFRVFTLDVLPESFTQCLLNLYTEPLNEIPFFARRGVPCKLALKLLLFG